MGGQGLGSTCACAVAGYAAAAHDGEIGPVRTENGETREWCVACNRKEK